MVVWSALAPTRIGTTPFRFISFLYGSNIVNISRSSLNQIQVRCIHRDGKSLGGKFNIVPSAFSRIKFKDMVSFYFLLGFLPALVVICYVNSFIGPATLTPIPEGYQPKHWEYYSHPITRFISKYIHDNPQKYYEKMCFVMHHRQEEKYLRNIENKVKRLIAERRDFQSWYYSPAMTKYVRKYAQDKEEFYHTGQSYDAFPMYPGPEGKV